MTRTWLLVAVLLVTATTTPALAASNDPPLVDAGLDQTTTRGTTVYLDGGGTRDPDPDGTVADYEWTITAPNGTTLAPDCPTCQRTHFRPVDVGTYEVTLRATDDDGATATDTLYVTVEPGEPPSAGLAGPTRLGTGDAGTFTADLAAGAAPLERAVWYVDGERRATADVDGTAATPTREFRFPTTGDHDVRVEVVDVDDQRATATRTVTVTAPTDGDGPTGGTTGGGTDAAPTYTIHGPRVVTGRGVLDADYALSDGASGTWYLDDARVDAGDTASLTLAAGRHELYAVPDAPAAGVAVFPDGGRTVVADPAPDLTVQRATNGSVTTVDAYATDAYGNLQSLTVAVDGEPVRTTTTESGVRSTDAGRQLTLLERLGTLDPGHHVLTFRARDARGQTDTAVRHVYVPGPPEVVSAGFVNDEPLDVYHPRIAPERYTGTYRVEIDLNGVDPEHVAVTIDTQYPMMLSEKVGGKTRKNGTNLVIIRRFARGEIGDITGFSQVFWLRNGGGSRSSMNTDRTSVTLSKPEIRIELEEAQNTKSIHRGAVFNASRSFDPDGSDLKFEWSGVSGGSESDGPTKKLDSWDLIKLNVSDEQDQFSTTTKLLDKFVPYLRTPQISNSGPFMPNETVTFDVSTQKYELSKATYENDTGGRGIELGLRASQGSVDDHSLDVQNPNGGEFDGSQAPSEQSYFQHSWTVSVPARAFLNDSKPTATIYSVDDPGVTRTIELPRPELYRQISSSTEIQDVRVRYLTSVPEYSVRHTTSESKRAFLEQMGYELYATHQSGIAYNLEKRVKVRDASYRTEMTEFRRRGRYRAFLESNPSWKGEGRETEVREWTTTEDVWRDHMGGPGTYTGRARQKRVQPARYRTERKYRYETVDWYRTTETYTDWVKDVDTRKVRRENCTPLGCREYTKTIRDVDWHRVTRTRTVTRPRTITHTYWGSIPRAPDHRWTGDTRRVQVQEAEYRQEYLFEIEHHHTETITRYEASHRELVEPAEYEWQSYQTVQSEREATLYTSDPNVRVGSRERTTKWTLRKKIDTRLTSRGETDPADVVETIVSADVRVNRTYIAPSGGTKAVTVTRSTERELETTVSKFISEDEAENIITDRAR